MFWISPYNEQKVIISLVKMYSIRKELITFLIFLYN